MWCFYRSTNLSQAELNFFATFFTWKSKMCMCFLIGCADSEGRSIIFIFIKLIILDELTSIYQTMQRKHPEHSNRAAWPPLKNSGQYCSHISTCRNGSVTSLIVFVTEVPAIRIQIINSLSKSLTFSFCHLDPNLRSAAGLLSIFIHSHNMIRC